MKFFITLGSTAFSNLPVIFAVGVAVGLARREKGSAALSGLLGFLVLHYVLHFLLAETGHLVNTAGMQSGDAKLALSNAMQTNVLGIQTMDLSVFGGIIVGITVYFVHKWAVKQELPTIIGFFSGPRFVPIVTMVVMSVVAVLLFFIWPTVQMGISALSLMILKSGPIGTFLYGLIERSLLPFGLHHGLNWPVRTTELGGSWIINGEHVSGTVNAYLASLADPSITSIDPSITRFNGGKFVYFMFGLSGAAFAMYKTAAPAKRKIAGSLLFAAAATSFLTGITEPIEFTFLFVAPLLYAAHAVLAGSALFVMHMLGAGVATPTGHGFINLVIYGVLQGPKTHWWLVFLVGIPYFFLYYFIFKFMILKFDFKTPGRGGGDEEVRLASKQEARGKYGLKIQQIGKEDGSTTKALSKQEKTHKQALGLIEAHGGADNILDVNACITRLRIDVKDKSVVDKKIIQSDYEAMGFAENGMQMQSIYGAYANVLKNEIRDILGMEE
ncbi:PTS transporter subunit EIIC [Streptococcus didelphis]|uniref:PTS transporter subunit EIIC n=2 Tax=Streptococcus didelphis TaxID=102886 RepID=A0ABY9LHR1_9STRE|nr:PTS transporter subunit EIIC [Streptococcus didelphis]